MNTTSRRFFIGLKRNICCRHYCRTPILGVLGHVDHGKTTLIDTLRRTNNVALEAGGITQRNSVFQHTIPENKFKFTIVDTPGHAAFSNMRVNGTVLTDIAILVVDAVEGVKQQTVECINLLNENQIPMVVALNKIDLPKADVEMCTDMLFDHGVELEDIGGSTPAVPISALNGTNIPLLMNRVKDVTDKLNLGSRLDGIMEGVIFDIQVNARRQILTTIVVKNGSVKKGDTFVTSDQATKVKALLSTDGKNLQLAKPGMPAIVIGPQHYSDNCRVGSGVFSLPPVRSSKVLAKQNKLIGQLKLQLVDDITQSKQALLAGGQKKISFFICADSKSTIEILRQMLEELDHDDLKLSVFSSSVKSITDEDLVIAESIDAQIILFNVPPLHKETTAIVHHHNVIYDLADSINTSLQDVLPPVITRRELGQGTVAEIHGVKKKRVAGINNLKGLFDHDCGFVLTRQGIPIWEGFLASLKFQKATIKETTPNMVECGVSFPKMAIRSLEVGDVLTCFVDEELKREFLCGKFFGKQNLEEDVY